MSTQDLSSAAIQIAGQYNAAGKTLVSAYRTGAHHLLGGIASRYQGFIGKRELPLVSEDAKARLLGAQEKVTSFLAQRVDIDTSRVVALMDRVNERTTSGIETIAKAATRVEESLGASVVNAISRANQPIVSISAKIADGVVAGANKIESRVAGMAAGASQETAVKTVETKPAVRRSRAVKA